MSAPRSLDLPLVLAEAFLLVGDEMVKKLNEAFRIERRRNRSCGKTLRPGLSTPLWNELRRQLRPHLRKYGQQVNLARLLGLPRQRVNAFVTGGGEMPDAERTLQLVAWLIALRQRRPPVETSKFAATTHRRKGVRHVT